MRRLELCRLKLSQRGNDSDMVDDELPIVDVVVLSRSIAPLHSEVQAGLDQQQEVRTILHRVHGRAKEDDQCRYETIARARNEGRARGAASWLMYLDDDVALDSRCIVTLIEELCRRPALAALAADYLHERRLPGIAPHVAMGATIFRRPVLAQLEFRWTLDRCECQCCCDDLRRRRWGIDYSRTAAARHLDGYAMREPCAHAARPHVGCSKASLVRSGL